MTRKILKTLLLQGSGKYVAVGFTEELGDADFYATRFNSDASTDTTFGDSGFSITRSGGPDDPQIGFILADGSVIAAGYSTGSGFAATFAKYQKDGGLDLNFGTQGLLISYLLPYGVVRDLYQQTTGIYAVCTTYPSTPYIPGNIGIIKIDTNGAADLNFGTSGSLTLGVDLSAWKLFLKGTSDNDLIVVGTSSSKPVLTRFKSDGQPADYFASTADPWTLIDNQPSLSEISAVAVSKTNSVFMLGTTADANLYLSKADSNGNLDSSFGNSSGYTTYDFGGADSAQALCLQSDSKIVVAGASTGIESIDGYAITVARFNSNGSIDTTFGTNGKLTIPGMDGSSRLLIVTDIKIDTDGSYLVLYTIETASAFVRVSKTGVVSSQYASGSSDADNFIGSDATEVLNGNAGDDILQGDGGNDIVYAGVGDDLIVGGDGKGDDQYFGGAGTDTVKYTSATWGIALDLGKGTSVSLINPSDKKNKDASGTGKDKLVDIENITAGDFNDLLVGSNAANKIEGMAGNDRIDGKLDNDTLLGGANNDTLIGGVGNDSLTGGAGNDRFVFDTPLSASSNIDIVADFGDGLDKIVLGKSIFKFAKGMVNKDGSMNSSATLNSYLIITGSGSNYSVSYDADGTGTKSQAVKFVDVTLTGQATLTVTDFLVL
jgi:uncharacterized delta-60 repeat protein